MNKFLKQQQQHFDKIVFDKLIWIFKWIFFLLACKISKILHDTIFAFSSPLFSSSFSISNEKSERIWTTTKMNFNKKSFLIIEYLIVMINQIGKQNDG